MTISGVILAGGEGKRTAPLDHLLPKPLLPICNIPLIFYHLKTMKDIGIKDVFIVVGNKSEEIKDVCRDGSGFDLNIHYVFQEERLGIAHAVGLLERHIVNPFLLILGDIFFLSDSFKDILERYYSLKPQGVISVIREDDLEEISKNFAVFLDEKGLIKRVVEKPKYSSGDFMGSGIYLFEPLVFDAIHRTAKTAYRQEYELTDSIQILIDDGYKIDVSENLVWAKNITYPVDLLESNLRQLRNLGELKIVGENVRIHSDAGIHNSIIGNNVRISKPIRVENSLILDDSTISGSDNLNNVIFSNDVVIECKSTWNEK